MPTDKPEDLLRRHIPKVGVQQSETRIRHLHRQELRETETDDPDTGTIANDHPQPIVQGIVLLPFRSTPPDDQRPDQTHPAIEISRVMIQLA
jgi:hypothetical protein